MEKHYFCFYQKYVWWQTSYHLNIINILLWLLNLISGQSLVSSLFNQLINVLSYISAETTADDHFNFKSYKQG